MTVILDIVVWGFLKAAWASGKIVFPIHRPPLPPGDIPATHFSQWLSQPQDQRAAGRLKSMKNPSDSIGNQICDHLACSTMPQSAVPLHRPIQSLEHLAILVISIHCLTYLHTYQTFLPRYIQCVILPWRHKVFETLDFILKWHGWPPENI